MKVLNEFFNCESGATAIEYGLIAALISVAIIGTVTTVGSDLRNVFSEVSKGLQVNAGTK